MSIVCVEEATTQDNTVIYGVHCKYEVLQLVRGNLYVLQIILTLRQAPSITLTPTSICNPNTNI